MTANDDRIEQLLEHIRDLGAELLRPGARPVAEISAHLQRARRELNALMEESATALAEPALPAADEALPLTDRISTLVDRRLRKRSRD